jgi:hypothetical protein
MFSSPVPILPAQARPHVDVDHVAAQVDSAQVALAAIARLAGWARSGHGDDLALRAELPAALSVIPAEMARDVARKLDSLGIALHAGLVALERARRAGRLNRAAAALLHAECAEALALALAGIGLARTGLASTGYLGHN